VLVGVIKFGFAKFDKTWHIMACITCLKGMCICIENTIEKRCFSIHALTAFFNNKNMRLKLCLSHRYIIWLFEPNNLAYKKQSFSSGTSFAKQKSHSFYY